MVNNIMNVPVTELRESQEEFNSTNRYQYIPCMVTHVYDYIHLGSEVWWKN